LTFGGRVGRDGGWDKDAEKSPWDYLSVLSCVRKLGWRGRFLIRFRLEISLMRRFAPVALLALLTACPTYDSAKYASAQDGLMPADEFAKYGSDQAVAIAVGREFGKAAAGTSPAELATQIDAGLAYAKKFPTISSVVADTLGHRLVLTFASGWHAQVVPITDGKSGDETTGLPK
jgi:hypothetical protein